MRPRNLNNPKELLDLWEEYKTYINDNPYKDEVVTIKGDIVEKKFKRPLLRQGFISFVFNKLGFVIKDYLDGKYEEYSEVATYIRGEWEENQIGGTMSGIFKAPNLTARLNGLVEKTENKNENTNIEVKANFGYTVIPPTQESKDNP